MSASGLSTAASCPVRPPTAEVDASARLAMLTLSAMAACWLIVAMLAALVSSIKLHGPNMLAGIPALTYGRLTALQSAVFLYGFASQAALAVALWLICRLGATTLRGGGTVVVSTLLWNLGVLLGSIAILGGGSSGFDRFEFPKGILMFLFIAYTVIGICAFLTIMERKECVMYPSLWFVLAGLVLFPWVLSTAGMVLWSPAVRGSVTPLVAAWAGNNIVALWLVPIALAAVYYLVPKLSGRALHSQGLAVFGFWLTVLFSQATGLHATAAFPAWVGSLSAVMTVLMILPVLANFLNWQSTWSGAKLPDDRAACFTKMAIVSYLLAGLLGMVAAFDGVNSMLAFTIFQTGLNQLVLLGFVAFALFGALAYILPRVAGLAWPKPSLVRIHFGATALGANLVFIPLIIGGVLQGGKLADSSVPFVDAARITLPFVGIAMIGYLLIAVGALAFLVNVALLAKGSCCPFSKEAGR